jgi:hypothetical protein
MFTTMHNGMESGPTVHQQCEVESTGTLDEEGLEADIPVQGGVVTLNRGVSSCQNSGCLWMLQLVLFPAKSEARFVKKPIQPISPLPICQSKCSDLHPLAQGVMLVLLMCRRNVRLLSRLVAWVPSAKS